MIDPEKKDLIFAGGISQILIQESKARYWANTSTQVEKKETKKRREKIVDYRIDERFPLGAWIDVFCKRHPANRFCTKNFGGNDGEKIFLDRKKFLVAGQECKCGEHLLRVPTTNKKEELF